jgi:hypothetical protein
LVEETVVGSWKAITCGLLCPGGEDLSRTVTMSGGLAFAIQPDVGHPAERDPKHFRKYDPRRSSAADRVHRPIGDAAF